MNDKNFDRAANIKTELKAANNLRYILSFPYPSIFKRKRRIFGLKYYDTAVKFIDLGPETSMQLETAIRDIIDRRINELNSEFKEL